MAEAKIRHLMTELHERFGNEEPSVEQQQLMDAVEAHLRNEDQLETGEPTPMETMELLVERLQSRHPSASVALGDLLEMLKSMGV